MRVLVLGAAGFIGSHLAAALRQRGALRGQRITELLLADSRALSDDSTDGLQGDICDTAFLQQLFAKPVDAVFHLAATLTLDAEQDFARGLAVNVQALMQLLALCTAQAVEQQRAPSFVFASSISTFGGPLPDTVGDHVAQTPQTS
jgi:nucleoside-diphosphate-sugar epimerase